MWIWLKIIKKKDLIIGNYYFFQSVCYVFVIDIFKSIKNIFQTNSIMTFCFDYQTHLLKAKIRIN